MIISKSPTGRFMLGIDLTEQYCQISYLYNKRARIGRGFVNAATGGVCREPSTFSAVPGEEVYDLPLVLCKLKGSSVWLAGQDAVDAANAGEGTAVTQLLQKAREEAPVLIDGEEYHPGSLLALYLRRCLSMLEPQISPGQIAAVAFTAPEMDYVTEQILLRAFSRLETGAQKVVCESHRESFYSYMLMQDAEQRRAGMLLCEYGSDGALSLSMLRYNRRTSPVVYWAQTSEGRIDPLLPGTGRDREFTAAVQESLKENEASAVYLTGEGFEGGWLEEAAAFLCRGRRVFQGENLFSKGAAYSALLHVDRPSDVPESIFLTQDALRSNIGIEVLLREQTGYHVLLDAGVKWYNAEVEEDFILENGKEFSLLRTPVTGGEPQELTIRLDGLPDRPDRTTRLRVVLTMTAPDRLRVQARDLGFGEIFPSGGGSWAADFEV